eukprot:TRINITY_DN13357_c0_g1_i2.p2 TRINITY_DN13357_c0_g1~~TRINITY_DN13357_c0_g1_i2.p2  ORF type:complete len:180 (+),score=40.10 TRINITY_DN13357_c0_g1_i2:121-660(+)
MAANGTQAPAPPPPPATSGGNSTSVRQVVAGVVVGVLAVAAALFYWWYTRQSKSQSRADGRKQEPSSAAAAGRVENSSPPAPAPAEEQQDGRATPGDADLEWQHACKLLLRASSAEHMPFSGTPRSYASGRSRQLRRVCVRASAQPLSLMVPVASRTLAGAGLSTLSASVALARRTAQL